jgi:hypothetical protein
MGRTVKLVGPRQREHAKRLIDEAPDGYAMALGEETRTQEQNRLMWPLIADLQRGLTEMAPYSADDIKLRFLHHLGQELRFLPELEGAGMFPVGQRSSTLTKAQFSGLIELLFQYGSKNGVMWSAKSVENHALMHPEHPTTPERMA